ncbi:unnamed protein product [Effrenium voratum]|uniref:AMP-dependent synthetase/ligase domain-containing protein n=1 Tax=Effrenium voratum TaxID=2562239 RepID=A0AA36JM62_9DINO|nr:unnamed protein product [Effrenium voratum]
MLAEVQDPTAYSSWELPCSDLRGASDADLDLHKLRETCQGSDGLWDLRAARLPGGVVRLMARVELIALDAGSVLQLAKYLDALYEGSLPAEGLPKDVFSEAMQLAVKTPPLTDSWKRRAQALPGPPAVPRIHMPKEVDIRRIWGALSSDTWQAFLALCRQHGLTPSAALTCCFQDVLRCHTGHSKDFTLNMTLTKRFELAAELGATGLVGDFTNCHLIACRPGPTFLHRALDLQEQVATAISEPCCGIELQQEVRRCHGDGTMLFDVVVTSLLAYGPWKPESLPHLGVKYAVTQTPQVSLDFQFMEQLDNVLLLSMDVAAHVVPLKWAQTVMQELETHLAQAVCSSFLGQILPQDPRRPHASFEAKEAAGGRLETSVLKTIHKHGLRNAVVEAASGKYLRYNDMGHLVAYFAQELRKQPLEKELSAVVMQKGWEQVLAILLAGGAYVPVNASNPDSYVKDIVEESGARCIMTQPFLRRRACEWAGAHVAILEVKEHFSALEPCCTFQDCNDLAYVIYTSGSTGKPKGVAIQHKAALNTCKEVNALLQLSKEDVCFGLASLSFDLSVWDIFGTLSAGAALVLCGADDTENPHSWKKALEEHSVTIWNSVPMAFQLLTHYQGGGALHFPRAALLSGDWIPVKLCRENWQRCRLICLGGATEASIWSNFHEVLTAPEEDQVSIPYGRALHNQRRTSGDA